MNRFATIFAAVLITLSLVACAKKEEAVAESVVTDTNASAAMTEAASAAMTEAASAAMTEAASAAMTKAASAASK